MYRFIFLSAASTALALGLAAHRFPAEQRAWAQPVVRVATEAPGAALRYGAPVKVGNGDARSYVLTDQMTGVPIEIGVALSAQALDGLPASGAGHHGAHSKPHSMPHVFLIDLPAEHGTPVQFVEMNWNPGSHEPPCVPATSA